MKIKMSINSIITAVTEILLLPLIVSSITHNSQYRTNYRGSDNHNYRGNNLNMLNILPKNSTDLKGTEDYCERSSFIADCSQQDSVVVIMSAWFGLMGPSKCIEQNFVNTSCKKDVVRLIDYWCGGRKSCNLRVTKIVDHLDFESCLKNIRGFLQVSYMCLPVVSRPANSCSSTSHSQSHVSINQPFGFLSNAVTSVSGCGSRDSPWFLEAKEGYNIVITLIDFSTALRSKNASHINSCNVFAMIKEGNHPSQTICGGERKISTVYVSQSNSISIDMGPSSSPPSSSDQHYQPFFLLKFTVTGCADIEEKDGLVVKRYGVLSEVYCEGGMPRSQLTCKDSSWEGTIPNCLEWKTSSPALLTAFWKIFSNSQWVALATILSIALIIGVVIFISGIFCLRKRRQAYMHDACGTPRCMVEYHLPRTGLPLERNGSVHSKSLSLDVIGNNSTEGSNVENDYFRTWQMHERNNNLASIYQTHHNIMTSSFKPLLQDDDRGRSFPPPPDHIYESPNFDRKLYEPSANVTPSHTVPHTSITNTPLHNR